MNVFALVGLLLGSMETVNDGYSYPLSVLPGDSLSVYINAYEKKDDYTLRLYDLAGQEVAAYQTRVSPQVVSNDKPWEYGYGYRPTLKIKTPAVKSGVYMWDNKIPVIIRRKDPKVVVVYSSNTENAYCNAGGKGLYSFNSTDKQASQVVSLMRPISLPKHSEAFLRWFHRENLEGVGYITDQELDRFKEYKNADLLIIVGHSEYWTSEARKNFDRFVDRGKSVLVLSGNTMWWKVAYSKNRDQMTCLRSEGHRNDPQAFGPGSIAHSLGVDFSRGGYGKKVDKGWDGFKIIASSPLLEGTKLKPGDTLALFSDESDGAPLSGFDSKGYPTINREGLGFFKAEIVGFDYVFRTGDGLATWVVFQRSRKAGIVINVSTTDWCSSEGISSDEVTKITRTMISKLRKKENVFSPPPVDTAITLHTQSDIRQGK